MSQFTSTFADKYIANLKKKKENITNVNFQNNYVAIQQALHDLREDTLELKQVKQHLDESKKTKDNVEGDHSAIESEYDLTCALQEDVESRAVYLSERVDVFKSVYRNHSSSSNQVHRDCRSAISKAWTWQGILHSCLGTHLTNAGQYQQFHHDYHHLLTDLDRYLLWLDSQPLRAPVKTVDPDTMSTHIMTILQHLHDLQIRSKRLSEQSKGTHPVHLRRERIVEGVVVRAVALVKYCQKNINFETADVCTVLDNSEHDRWLIRSRDGQVAEVPSIILVIPPPDTRCFEKAQRVQGQMSIVWKNTAQVVRKQIMQFLTNVSKVTLTNKVVSISLQQKTGIMCFLNEAIEHLRGPYNQHDDHYQLMRGHLVAVRKVLSQVKPGEKDVTEQSVSLWGDSRRCFRLYQDMLVYREDYEHSISRHFTQEPVFLPPPNSPTTFVTNAYFERALPIVKINPDSRQTEVSRVEWQLRIHERFCQTRSLALELITEKLDTGREAQRSHRMMRVSGGLVLAPFVKIDEQRRRFVIVGVSDQKGRKDLSVCQAIDKGILNLTHGEYTDLDTGLSIPIAKAIEIGLIAVEYGADFMNGTTENGTDTVDSTPSNLWCEMHTDVCSISGIINPLSGEGVDLQKAFDDGLLDEQGDFHNPVTGEEMTLTEAVSAGYLIVDSDLHLDTGIGSHVFTSLVKLSLKVDGVWDPSSRAFIHLHDAVDRRLLDPVNCVYTDPVSGEEVTVTEAVKLGLVRGEYVDDVDMCIHEDVLTVKKLQIKQERFLPVSVDQVEAAMTSYRSCRSPGEFLFEKLRSQSDISRMVVFDPSINGVIGIEEAIREGIIKLDAVEFKVPGGEAVPLQEAASSGFLQLFVLEELYKLYEECSFGQLIDRGFFDPKTGMLIDDSTGESMTMERAACVGSLDLNTVFFFDMNDRQVKSLGKARSTGRFNAANGRFVHTVTGQEMTVSEAEQCGDVVFRLDAVRLTRSVEALAVLRDVMDTTMKGVYMSKHNRLMDVEEAVVVGALNVSLAAYFDSELALCVPLHVAAHDGNVDAGLATALYSAFDKLSLGKAVSLGKVDCRTGQVVLENGDKIDMKSAQQMGAWNPFYVYCVDNESSNVTTLGGLIEIGKLNVESGKLTSRSTRQQLSIQEAIDKGVITADIDPERFLNPAVALGELIDRGQVADDSAIYVTADGACMPLRKALADGFLMHSSKVRLDASSGEISLVFADAVVSCMDALKEYRDWLNGLEQVLASRDWPGQRPEILSRQSEDVNGLLKEIHDKDHDVQLTILHAEQLIRSVGHVRSDQHEASHQVQLLKSNTADVKAHFHSLANLVTTCCDRMECLLVSLRDAYFHLRQVDQWYDEATERIAVLLAGHLSLDDKLTNFKSFLDEVKDKEQSVVMAAKCCVEFKGHAQKYEGEIGAFTKQPRVGSGGVKDDDDEVLCDEIAAAESKLREVSWKCTKNIDKLCSVTKDWKMFSDITVRSDTVHQSVLDRVEEIGSHLAGQKMDSDDECLNDLHGISADLLSQDITLKELTSVGKPLADCLLEMGIMDEANEVLNVMEMHGERRSKLLEDVDRQERCLLSLLSEQHNLVSSLNSVHDMVVAAKGQLSQHRLVSLDRALLNEQIEAHRIIDVDLFHGKTLLDTFLRSSQDVPGADDHLVRLGQQLQEVQHLSLSRTEDLEGIASALLAIESKSSDIGQWLTDSIKSMKTLSKGLLGKAQLAEVHYLFEAMHERSAFLEDLNVLCVKLIADNRVTDAHAVTGIFAEVKGIWNELSELLVNELSMETMTEVEGYMKYMDNAENVMSMAQPIMVDPESICLQLRDHSIFDKNLAQRRRSLKDVIANGRAMLCETANMKTDEIEARWESIEHQANLLARQSSDRLTQLESALPLATHLAENVTEVEAWLEEVESELQTQGEPGDTLEEVKKQHEQLKTTQQIIEDHKLFVDDLNSTGLDLMDLCGMTEATDLHVKLLAANTCYETLRSQARLKDRALSGRKQVLTQDVADSIDDLLEDAQDLSYVIRNADPVPAAAAKLKNEIDENTAIMDDLVQVQVKIDNMDDIVRNMIADSQEDKINVDDMRVKIKEIDDMADNIKLIAEARKMNLSQTLTEACQLADLSTDVMSSLHDLKDSLLSQQIPGIDAFVLQEQQNELTGIVTELGKAKELIGQCHQHADIVCQSCGKPGAIEIRRQLEDLIQLADDVSDIVQEKSVELRRAFYHVTNFRRLFDTTSSWLPLAENQLAAMRPPSSEPAFIKDQIDELKLFKSQILPHVVDMTALRQHLVALKDQSPIPAECLCRPVSEANEKWNSIVRGIRKRETELISMQATVGGVEASIVDVLATLDEISGDIVDLVNAHGDTKYLEITLRKIQVESQRKIERLKRTWLVKKESVQLIQSDVQTQKRTVANLLKAVGQLTETVGGDGGVPTMLSKQHDLTDKLSVTKISVKDAEINVQEKIKQVKRFFGEIGVSLLTIGDLHQQLKDNVLMAALPETAEDQYNAVFTMCQELDGEEGAVQSLLTRGQDLLDESLAEHVMLITEKLNQLKDRWQDAREYAVRQQGRMKEHMKNVFSFHDSLKAFTDWLNSTEVSLCAFVYPSKLVDRVVKQMDEHEAMKSDLDKQSKHLAVLDHTGTFLKHFSKKHDTVYIKNLMVGIHLRWKKIIRRTDERGRLLQQAYKEDKGFYDAWSELCNWLEEGLMILRRIFNPHPPPVPSQHVMKSDIEQLKKFQAELQVKNAIFNSTTRLGRSLKDRCTKQDPEHAELSRMLEELRSKWSGVKSATAKCQYKLDEALLTSGRVSDACQSLMDWLQKAESTLADDMPVYGDLDTVLMLIEQHRNLQQELSVREPTVTAMRQPGNLPPIQHDELSHLWDRVAYLCEIRENQLMDALKLAEEFQTVVTIMREFLPEAEGQLKFRSLPNDDVVIAQMIERHQGVCFEQRFEAELADHQHHVDKIKSLAVDILHFCHPNAVRFVKYYVTITQTRWAQLLERARNHGLRLRDAQRSLHSLAQSEEEMLGRLAEYQALLATKESDPVPHNLKVVEELLQEHQEVYEELLKLSESEDFVKIMSSDMKSTSPAQNNVTLNDVGRYNPRHSTLQHRWRCVSQIAVERKKNLQDAYDMLQELESFKNFDFDSWREKYLKWIQAKKFRITDFFRRQDRQGDGFLNAEEFITGMLQSGFPTNKTELHAVFDIFDREKRGVVDYRDFVDALKSDKFQNQVRYAATDSDLIQDSIELETSSCTCRNQYTGHRVAEGKYRFGEKQKLVMMRLLNKSVMVRVGGGWLPLDQFVLNNDPCKGSGGTGNLRKGRFTLSMGNLSANLSAGLSLRRSTDYVSTGNLSGEARPKMSQFSTSGRRTPTPGAQRRQSTATPQPAIVSTVAFGSSVPRSRPNTPTSLTVSSYRRPLTPSARSVATTPTKQLGLPVNLTTRHRRLPHISAVCRTRPATGHDSFHL